MKKYVKRYLALILTFALVISVPFAAFTQKASAASKKTKYVVTQETRIAKEEGENVTTVYNMQYYKNGLLKARIYKSGSKTVYIRNKKGYITTVNEYDSKGKLEDTWGYTYKYDKKGNAISQTDYYYDNGVKKIGSTTKFKNYKNGKIKKETYVDGDYSWIVTYNKKGDVTSEVDKGKTYSYTYKYKYKYDKKGNPVKVVRTYSGKDSEGSESSVTTTTYKYKYDKHKNVKKAVITKVYKSSNYTYTDTTTELYKYKKVKVPKKFLKFFR